MLRPTLLPAALVLAAGVVPAAAAAGDVPAEAEAVVRLSATAPPAAGDEGVVIRAQNCSCAKCKAKAARRPARPARRPAPAPAPGPVRPVSGEYAGGGAIHGAPAAGPLGGHVGGEVCPQCNGHCPPGGCPGCMGTGLFCPGGYFNRGGVWTPRHVHNYSYDAPRNLAYPAGANPNVPGQMGPMPVVQYPYYTTKGPDDFFHDRDGEF